MSEDAKHERFQGYAVFLYPQALEILGEAIRPYLHDGPHGPHVLCGAIDTGGALIEMTLEGRTGDDQAVEIELMIPSNMVRMIVSARSDGAFGFGPRVYAAQASPTTLPPVPLASSQLRMPVEFASPMGNTVPPAVKLPPEG